MNKTIALLILGVILLAMGLILVNQYMTVVDERAAAENGAMVPSMTAPVTSAAPVTTGQRTPASEAPALPSWADNAQQSLAASATPGTNSLTPPALPQGTSSSMREKPSSSLAPSDALLPKPESVPEKTGAASGGEKPVQTKLPTPKVESKPETGAAAKTDTKPETKKEQPRAAPPTQASAQAPAKASPPKAEAVKKTPKTIKKITVLRMEDGAALRMETSEDVVYKSTLLKSPDRLVVDLDGQWAVRAPGVPENKFISNVRIGKQADKTRIVIDLRQVPTSVRYLKREPDGLEVRMK